MKARNRGALAVLGGALAGTAFRYWYLVPTHPELQLNAPFTAANYALVSIVVAFMAIWLLNNVIDGVADVEDWQ